MLNSSLIRTLVLLAIVTWSVSGTFPDDPKPCKHGDSQCIGKMLDYIVKEKFSGDESIDLAAFDPLPIKKLHVKQGGDSPVNIDLLFTNNVALGIKTSKFVKLKGFGKDIATKHELVAKADKLQLLGDYTISGSVLILPIRGTGKSTVTMIEPTLTLTWTGVPYEKDGETYMKLDNFNVDLNPKKMSFNFENLFNDKALSDNMNAFLTENWKEVYPEIRRQIGHGFALVARKVISRVFEKYPYNKLIVD